MRDDGDRFVTKVTVYTRKGPSSLFGTQTWVALPEHAEDVNAEFEHYSKQALPFLEGEGKEVHLIIGTAWGERAPTRTFNECVLRRCRVAARGVITNA